MNRRDFLKALGAIGAGIALRPIPVLGEQYSVLEPPFSVAGPTLRDDTVYIRGLIDADKPEYYLPDREYLIDKSVFTYDKNGFREVVLLATEPRLTANGRSATVT